MPPLDLTQAFAALIVPAAPVKRGRPAIGDKAMTSTESSRKSRRPKQMERHENIAILDMETDPFDDLKAKIAKGEKLGEDDQIKPFLAVLYSDNFDPVVIWNEDFEKFVSELIAAIEALPERYTIYAHNGGKFDFMFLIKRMRGFVKFKGRGIMSANIGGHELRDSFHIIPEKLANWKKDDFDYTKLRRGTREQHRAETIKYCIADCRYLLEIVKKFVHDFGLKISIGQAAMTELKKEYKNVASLGQNMDAYLRRYFFGGRVECLAGRGIFEGAYKLYDVNSMYPYVMANFQHPIGSEYLIRSGGPVGKFTRFVEIECDNYGGLVKRSENNETSATDEHGTYLTTIWEYQTALKYNLIDNVRIIRCLDCVEATDFSRFVNPLYDKRQLVKQLLPTLTEGSAAHDDARKDDIFYKLILNNAYGKFAQNPRRFKESYITDCDERPPADEIGFGDFPAFRNEDYAIWERPCPSFRFNNVGTAASITGAARAVLMEAIQLAVDPIYCDTDSLICKSLDGLELHNSKLGAWKLEKELDAVIIAGKKLYAYKVAGLDDCDKGRIKVRSKGASGLTWNDLEQLLDDQIITSMNKGVTITKHGHQYYMQRRIRATTPRMINPRVSRQTSERLKA
jgi:DNA polymerase elongation subunit (family B)